MILSFRPLAYALSIGIGFVAFVGQAKIKDPDLRTIHSYGALTEKDIAGSNSDLYRLFYIESKSWAIDSKERQFKKITGFLSYNDLNRKPLTDPCPFPEEDHYLIEGRLYTDGKLEYRANRFTAGLQATKPGGLQAIFAVGKIENEKPLVIKSHHMNCSLFNDSLCSLRTIPNLSFQKIGDITNTVKKAGKWNNIAEYITHPEIMFKFACTSKENCIVGSLKFAEASFSKHEIKRHPKLEEDKPLVGVLDLMKVDFSGAKVSYRPMLAFQMMGYVFQQSYFLQSNYPGSAAGAWNSDSNPSIYIRLRQEEGNFLGKFQLFTLEKALEGSFESDMDLDIVTKEFFDDWKKP